MQDVKQMVLGFLMLLMLLTGISGICNQMKKHFYSEGADLALEDAIRHSLMALAESEKNGHLLSEKEMYGECLKDIVLELGDMCTCKITVYELDAENGEIDMELCLNYKDIYGEAKNVKVRKKAVLQSE